MMVFTESLFQEDPLWVNKNGRIYGTDANGKEFEISADLVNRYMKKHGGTFHRFQGLGNTLGGMALGAAASFPVGIGAAKFIQDHGGSTDLATAAFVPIAAAGALGGTALGLGRGINHGFNDIVRARREGRI